MKWQSILISLQKTQLLFSRRDYVILKGHVVFTATVVTKVFISLQRNVTTMEPSAMFGPKAEDGGVAEQKNTKGTVTWVLFITTFTALSKILKFRNKECFKCEMSDSAFCLNSHGKG